MHFSSHCLYHYKVLAATDADADEEGAIQSKSGGKVSINLCTACTVLNIKHSDQL